MTYKAKKISLIIGILVGLAALVLLFASNGVSANNNRVSGIRQTFHHAVAHGRSSWVFNQAIKILNNQ